MIVSAGALSLTPNVSATQTSSLKVEESNGHFSQIFNSPVAMVCPTDRLETGTHVVSAWWDLIFDQCIDFSTAMIARLI